MEVKGSAKHLKITPKKMRLVIDVVRGMAVERAEAQLHFVPRKASVLILKALRSVAASAEHNFNLKKDNLFIKKIIVNDGPSLERWTPKAFGRATPIKKRTSHLEIILAEYKPTIATKRHQPLELKKEEGAEPAPVITNTEKQASYKTKPSKKDDQKIRPKQTGVKSKIFSRKTI
ncbi:MAG: 50S ribosomal protein L22 [Candidatus Parcubacteria bacterium]|nr:50S ribosomal protein L22 [Candidatus Parcubacteria bacterium]